MRTLTKHLFAALLGTALLASCSRPVAYFQPTAREQFAVNKPEKAVVAAPADVVVETVVVSNETPAVATEQVAQAKQAVSQIEAYVRNDSKLAASKTLNKRMARLNNLLTTATDKATVSTKAASTRKMTLMERTILKKMDKKIKNHVAPDKTDAMNSNVRLGVIIGVIGLILLILGGGSVLGVLGLIGFIVGLVLILLGVING
ncbi:hypothetical protein [Spirosoma spitsbergense]|uniref:hypothetical protein n=1 Tax=Spirosoma spitsbergense TaxID=431554 RepID=UPI000377E542|nr:hypothetical protein [Spirosoma spitsbergense]